MGPFCGSFCMFFGVCNYYVFICVRFLCVWSFCYVCFPLFLLLYVLRACPVLCVTLFPVFMFRCFYSIPDSVLDVSIVTVLIFYVYLFVWHVFFIFLCVHCIIVSFLAFFSLWCVCVLVLSFYCLCVLLVLMFMI